MCSASQFLVGRRTGLDEAGHGIGVIPIAQRVAGLLAERPGVRHSFLVPGGVMLVALALLFGRRWRAHGRVELDAERV